VIPRRRKTTTTLDHSFHRRSQPVALRLLIRSYCKERSVKDRRSTVPLDSLVSMWAAPKVLRARADLEGNVVPAVSVEADKDLAARAEAAERSLVAAVVDPAAGQEVARVAEALSAVGVADVFFASK
jgi:hypothetical protein